VPHEELRQPDWPTLLKRKASPTGRWPGMFTRGKRSEDLMAWLDKTLADRVKVFKEGQEALAKAYIDTDACYVPTAANSALGVLHRHCAQPGGVARFGVDVCLPPAPPSGL
jgi:hypothetical protein